MEFSRDASIRYYIGNAYDEKSWNSVDRQGY